MSISSSFRILPPKIPLLLQPKFPILKTLIVQSAKFPTNLSLYSPISIQKLSTTKLSSSPSSNTSTSLQPVEELPQNLQDIIKLFQTVEEPKKKYEQLLFYGKKLTPLDKRYKTEENKVKGCVSQVWVRAYLDSNRENVLFEADSDSVLTKGLAALLIQGLSGLPVPQILKVTPDFVTLLGLNQSLTPSRNNGFLNMLRLMQNKALQLYIESQKQESSSSVDTAELGSENQIENSEIEVEELKTEEVGSEDETNGSLGLKSRGERIKEKLEKELAPVTLEIEDISYQHAGHAGVRGNANGETHFNVRVVSKEFDGKSLVKRHRLVYDLLQEELQSGLHALSIVAKTPAEVSGK
ncbi:hypothetical protein C5167_009634 [Papaver somniferum]|uniref:Fe-S metabolism associated domain-containing protein n=1 Tax=Papaver somniferum TaxID=3469 RepID=A0A4Y7K0U7_PAPSO|nr:sufE-like protein 1, chloroplastic/mitochondrial [Papaver somniferum]RZC65940.1 hypothetical protein C5167_009634 [Papaver somniferum]